MPKKDCKTYVKLFFEFTIMNKQGNSKNFAEFVFCSDTNATRQRIHRGLLYMD